MTEEEKHIVRLIKTISDRYFKQHRTLVICSSGNDTEEYKTRRLLTTPTEGSLNHLVIFVTQIFYSEQNFPVKVLSYPQDELQFSFNESKYSDKQASYVMLLSDVSLADDTMVTNFAEQLQILASSLSWNPRGKFIVSVLSNSGSRNKQSLVIKGIFEKLWIYKVINVVVAIKQKSKLNGKVTEVLNIYTWFPYQTPKKCKKVEDIVLLDSWVMNGYGHLLKSTNLYPLKTQSLNGCPLGVAAKKSVPFVEDGMYDQKKKSYVFNRGWEVRVLDTITEKLNTWSKFPKVQGFFYNVFEKNGTVTGFTRSLMYGGSDVAFSALFLRNELIELADMTRVYFMNPWKWYMPCPLKVPRWRSIPRIFSYTAWFIIFLVLFFSAVFMRYVAKLVFLNTESQIYNTVVENILNAWAVILGVSVSVQPRSDALRTFFLAWILYSFAINTIFQAFLTSYLVDPGYEDYIDSLEDLLMSNMKYGFSRFTDDTYFKNNNDDWQSETISKNRILCPSIAACYNWTALHRNFSTTYQEVKYQHDYLSGKFIDKYGQPLACEIQDGTMAFVFIGMVMTKGTPLLDRFNSIIGQIIESGLFMQWVKESYYSLQVKAKTLAIDTLADEYCSLALGHMQGVFLLFAFGIVVSVIVFVGEIFYHKRMRCRMRIDHDETSLKNYENCRNFRI
ncbi:uncharacterized protein [Periplaneta americana]|uniref:uncharacterized protein n=1 Tax=Periplaneta americana TaxID=6978 RepID=UPI0037E6FAEF